MAVIEALTEEEMYLYCILHDPSGLDLAEFTWHDPAADNPEECFRAWPFQWTWFRDDNPFQIDQCARAVGKSLSIKMRAFAFPFLFPNQAMLITAPELNHLEAITSIIEETFFDIRLGREMLLKGRGGSGGITHRPFLMKFANQAQIIGRIPQRDGKGIKGQHPVWLELDEAQDYPEQGWLELVETLKRGWEGATWRAHGVTRGVQDKFYEYTQDDSKWKVHHITAMHRPNWNDEERQEKMELYGSKDNPDYRRNILGVHGDATNPIFVMHQFMRCVDMDPASEYNEHEYFNYRLTAEILEDRKVPIEATFNLPTSHKANYQHFWIGMDVGFTIHPSEILVFGEYRPEKGKDTKLKLLTRVHLRRIRCQDQARVVLYLIDHYRPHAFSMDKSGNGLPLFQMIQDMAEEDEHLKQYWESIKGYSFSGKLLVDFDKSIEVDEYTENAADKAGIERNVVEYSTDRLRMLVDQLRFELPYDRPLIRDMQGQTETVVRYATNEYGKKRYSGGEYHCLDAARMAVLGWAQFGIEAFMAKERFSPVLDQWMEVAPSGAEGSMAAPSRTNNEEFVPILDMFG